MPKSKKVRGAEICVHVDVLTALSTGSDSCNVQKRRIRDGEVKGAGNSETVVSVTGSRHPRTIKY